MLLKKILFGTIIAGIAGATTGGIIHQVGSRKAVIANLEAAQLVASEEIKKNGFMSEATQKRLEAAQDAAQKYIKAKK